MKIPIIAICTILFLANTQSNGQNEFDVGGNFIPAGYMGCPDDIELNSAWKIEPFSKPFCFRISYSSTCSRRYAGIHWTNRADDSGANWGQYPGENFSEMNYTKLRFKAKGQNGGEVIEFGFGGIDKAGAKYKDSSRSLIKGRIIELSSEWDDYEILLNGKDLSSVISGFYWSASWNDNPSGIIFFLDDINLIKE